MYSTGFRWVPDLSGVQVDLPPCGVQYILITGLTRTIMTAHRIFPWLHLLACHILLFVNPGLPLHYRIPRNWQGFQRKDCTFSGLGVDKPGGRGISWRIYLECTCMEL